MEFYKVILFSDFSPCVGDRVDSEMRSCVSLINVAKCCVC